MGIKIITGHNNMDLDCIGSIALACYLFPDHQPMVQRIIHPVARGLYNLYKNELNFLTPKELAKETLEHAVIVDTKSYSRVREIFDSFPDNNAQIEIFDHHEAEQGDDFPNAVIHMAPYGANVTQLVLEIIHRDIHINSVAATLGLAGIYSDTGYFSYQNVTPQDFIAASYFMEHGALVNVISKYMKPLKEDYQIELFHKIVNQMIYQEINGHFIILSYIVLEKQKGGLAAVVEQLGEIEKPDAVFALFCFKNDNNVLIVARSNEASIDCDVLMRKFAGAGHPGAASALVKNSKGRDILANLLGILKTELEPALTAKAVMQRDVMCVKDVWNVMQASLFLEKIDHSGAPVMGNEGTLLGMITLRDIMKARRAGQMNSPVKAYMRTKLVTCRPETTFRRVEELLYSNNIGHLPVTENGDLVGFITRSDLIRVAGEG
jgi:tRNA nucleotidyltransferase (CCA-adding enzyme)